MEDGHMDGCSTASEWEKTLHIPGRGSVSNRFVPQFSFTSPIFYGI